MTVEELSFGNIRIHGLRDGYIHLDGGAMFGVVPRVMWEKLFLPDIDNRIALGLNSLLIKTAEKLILIETGVGTHLKKRFYNYYGIEQDPGLTGALAALGTKPEEIDIVINTHLHFDHCGGNTVLNEKGKLVPTFPNAEYIIQKGEWEAALNPTPRDKASYIKDNFEPLEKAGMLRLVEGNMKIAEGIEVLLAPGHTLYHQCVKITSKEQTVFFMGDMVPTSAHVGLPYIMSYDLYPVETLKSKQRYYDLAEKEDWIVAFNHDPIHYYGKIFKKEGKYTFHPLV